MILILILTIMQTEPCKLSKSKWSIKNGNCIDSKNNGQ